MGAGIAHAFALAGREVVVVETSAAASAAAYGRIETTLRRAEERGAISGSAASVLERVRTTSDPAELSEAVLVVEAVPEDAELKKAVLASVEHHAPRAWLASNTSSLSLDGLAADLTRPERLVGLHFFNPVPVSELVEVVVGSATAEELIELADGWANELGKTAVLVRDSPGFASSRLGVALALEAMRMLEDGVASAADIDTAMTLGYKHPVGPLRTTDIVGLDVRLAISEHLARELGERFAPPQLLRDLVRSGHLGRKTGRGFYRWP
jgi:3-hydroxybutyryl-CoA dehydrogenase